jgi:hypothetical protein
MTTRRKAAAPVNRLVDIQVEEVSLVDRAANEHRFLIVKRSDTPMADTQPAAADDVAATDDPVTSDASASTNAEAASDPVLSHAVAALEGLTSTVELLGTLGAGAVDGRLGPLAAQLQATAEALLSRAGLAPSDAEAASQVEDLNAVADDAPDDATFADRLAAARDAIARLAALSSSAPAPTAAPPIPAELGASLAAMTESFRSLTETVKSQQQRIARVEKQFGLPNSAPSPERVRKAEPEEVGWPMDLNQRMDRESVDKAVSFHDL